MPEQDLASLTGVQKATSIGPPQPGTRIQPTPGEGPLTTLARWLVGDIRPSSVVAQDPFGITGWERGAGQPPLMFGTTQAPGEGAMEMLAQKFPRLAKVIKAYHGSPHDFEQFDLSKIGTGEGAQAYGHGLYFAENPAVAESYKPFGDSQAVIQYVTKTGQQFVPRNEEQRFLTEAATYLQRTKKPLEQALPEVEAASRLRTGQNKWDVLDGLKLMRDHGLTERVGRQGGRMYEVAIHADPDQFLDWDKPLSQEMLDRLPAAARTATTIPPEGLDMSGGGRILPNHHRQVANKPYPYILKTGDAEFGISEQDVQRMLGGGATPTGNQAYTRLTAALGGQAQASEALRQAGIPGIKYLDQGSRAVGQGSYNYVVNNDKIIEIMKKYGVGLAVAQQIYQRQQQEQGK